MIQSPADSTPVRPNILIFRSALLAASETFIPAQGEKLERFTAQYAGLIPVDGYPLPSGRKLLPTASLRTGRMLDAAAIFGIYPPRFLRQIRELAPVLIHAHFEESGIKAQGLARRLGVPLVTTSHGYDMTVDDYRWRRYPGLAAYHRKRKRDLQRDGRLFLGVSRFICDLMLRRGYPEDKVRLHYIGVDTALFSPPPPVPRRPVVLFVGRLVENKRCTDVVSAMAEAGRSFPEAELVIIGDGPLRAGLEAQVREAGVRARFLGTQPASVVREALAGAMIFCVPSARIASGASEGFGQVFLEASAMRVPVVSTRVGGIPEAVEDGVTGLLCNPRAPLELADSIKTLLGDQSLAAKMGDAGRARALEQFDLAKQTCKLEQLYAGLCG